MKKITLILFFLMTYGLAEVRIKFATLAPKSSAWGRCLSLVAREVWKKTDKQVLIKVYYGAQMGDEEEMAKKITVGQLDGAAFTGNGLGYVCHESRVMEVPFLFNSYEEVDYVYKHLENELNIYFKKNNFYLLGYLDAGYAYFFSQVNIKNFQDIRESKMWMWKGDTLAEVFMRVLEVPAIAIGFTEVVPSLQTGLIDGFYCTPTAAISLQWHLDAKYLLDQPFCSVTSGLVMAEKSWQKLSPNQQDLLIRSVKNHVAVLKKKSRQSDRETIQLLAKERGYQINDFNGDTKEFAIIREKSVNKMIAKGFFTESLYSQVEKTLQQYQNKDKKDKIAPR